MSEPWTAMKMPVLETARLTIRPLVMDDLPACHQLFTEVGATIDSVVGQAETIERRRGWLEWTIRNYDELARLIQPPYGDRAIALKDSGRFVGLVGLVPLLKPFGQLHYFGGTRPEQTPFTTGVGLFWAVTPSLQRRGIATEAARALIDYAFGTLKLGRITANTEYENAASIGVMRRLGMRIEKNPHAEPHWLQITGILEAPTD